MNEWWALENRVADCLFPPGETSTTQRRSGCRGRPQAQQPCTENRGRRTHQGCLLRPPATGWRGHRTASVTSRSDRLRQGRAVSGQKPTPVLRRLCSVRLISLDRISNNIHHITLAAQQRRFRINALLDPKANTSLRTVLTAWSICRELGSRGCRAGQGP